jgi:drug/metabolite transporter (DMT)-like permease
MVYDLPIYVWALVLVGAIGIPAATSAVLYRGAIAAGLDRRAATTVTTTTGAVLGGWLVVSGLLARAGVYRQDPGETVPWFLVAVGGTLIALLLATRIPLISRILSDPGTPARLALPHSLRVIGVSFLIVMALGHLPAAFSSVGLLLQPVAAGVLAWAILGESLGWWQALGGAVVLTGIVLAAA